MESSDPFGYIFKRTQLALRGAMDDALVTVNLTTPQYAALSEPSKEQGLSNAELARRCFVTPQTMHQILGGLERTSSVTKCLVLRSASLKQAFNRLLEQYLGRCYGKRWIDQV